jgi:HEAT repeat protein
MLRRADSRLGLLLGVFCVLGGVSVAGAQSGAPQTAAQEPAAPQAVSADQLKAAIDKLGDFDYDVRSGAARTVRRTVATQAVPALLQAVAEHADGYVRYRALVILTGFNDPRTSDAMRESRASPNDRLRTVAYSFFEHHPDRALIGDLLNALDQEQGEFVRPSLVRALVAHGAMFDDPRIREALLRDVGRGEDYFRSAVIEALGDYKALYAYDALVAVARLDGPLQDDAALALGKIGDKRAVETLAMLQRSAPRQAQPTVAAAICLLGVNCASHENYLIETLKFANSNPNLGFQELLRSAAAGLGALAIAGGHDEAVEALFEIGIPSHDPTRAPVSLALGAIALRNTTLMLSVLGEHADRARAIDLVGEGFDMLEEDLDKETFFAAVRRAYWAAPEGSANRQLMQTLIGKLDF